MISNRSAVGQRRTTPLSGSLYLAVIAAFLLLAWTAGSAHAASGYFCPPTNPGTIGLAAYGSAGNADRCAHSYHSAVDQIQAMNVSTPVEKCAVLKTNSDGSGANVGGLAAACATGTSTAIQFPSGWGGYATIINKGANYHTGFWGWLAYH